MSQKISKDAKILMIIDWIYSIIGLFSSTFLVAYFLKITNESILQISIYYIISFSVLGIGQLLLGKAVKTKQFIKTKLLSVGIVIKAVFILAIATLREKISIYFPVVAILYGVAEMFFWSSHEVIQIEVTTNNNRKRFMSIKKIIGKLIGIIAPIILGSSIELYSFSKIAIYVFALSLIQIVLSFSIKTTNTIKNSIEEYSIKKFKKSLNAIQREKINKYKKSIIAYGIIESSVSTLVTIITIMTFKTSLNLGILTSVFSVFSMISLYLYNKYYTSKNAKFILYLCSGLIVLGVVGLIFDINKVTLVIFKLFYGTNIVVLDVIYNTKKGNMVKECNIEKWKVEWVIYSDLFITLGRVIGYVLMLIAGILNNILIFKILLTIVTLFAPVYAKLMYKVEKINNKEDI